MNLPILDHFSSNFQTFDPYSVLPSYRKQLSFNLFHQKILKIDWNGSLKGGKFVRTGAIIYASSCILTFLCWLFEADIFYII